MKSVNIQVMAIIGQSNNKCSISTGKGLELSAYMMCHMTDSIVPDQPTHLCRLFLELHCPRPFWVWHVTIYHWQIFNHSPRWFSTNTCIFSSSNTWETSSVRDPLGTHHIVRTDCEGHLQMAQETSRHHGSNFRPPSLRSHWCYLLHSWTETQRHCWPILLQQPRNYVNSCQTRLG